MVQIDNNYVSKIMTLNHNKRLSIFLLLFILLFITFLFFRFFYIDNKNNNTGLIKLSTSKEKPLSTEEIVKIGKILNTKVTVGKSVSKTELQAIANNLNKQSSGLKSLTNEEIEKIAEDFGR